MVRLSMAVACLVPVDRAYAQLNVTCQPMRYGDIAPCAGGSGKVTVTPGGAVNTAGCLVLLGAPAPAVCKATGITSTTGSLRFSLPTNYTQVNTGGNTMKLSLFNIGTAAAGRIKNYLSASITGTKITAPIGGRLRIDPGQAVGTYSGSLIMTVTFTP